jgi:PAS domain S-box-containing protein
MAHIGYWEWNVQTGALYWSQENYGIFGLPPETRPSVETFLSAVQPDDQAMVKQSIADALEGRKPYDLYMRIRCPDGTERVVHAYGEVDRDAGGKPIRFSGTAQDVTERRRSEEAMRVANLRLRAIAAHTPDHILMQDRHLRYTMVINPQMGLTEADMIGKTDADFLREEDAGKLTAIKRKVMETGTPYPLQTSLRNQKGADEFFDGAYVPLLAPDGSPEGLIGYFRNITESKRAEEKLGSVMKAVESASDAIGISDAKGCHFYQNKALSDLFGYAAAEELQAAGGGPAVVKDPEVARQMFENIMSGTSWAGELEMVTKSGRVFPAYERADAIKNSDGKVIGLIGVITDITERKKAEEALKQSEDHYRALFDRAGEGVFLMALDGRLLAANEAFAHMHGYSVEEMRGMSLKDLDAPDTFQRVPERMARLQAGEALTFEVEHYHKDGHVFPLEVSASLIRSGNEVYLQCFHRDITARKRAEAALRESEKKFRILVEKANDIVYSLTPEGVFTYVSPSWTRLLGHDVSEVENHPFQPFVHPEDISACLAFLERTIKTGVAQASIEYRALHKDGNWRWHTTNASALHDDSGRVVTYLAIAHDITDRKQAEAKQATLQSQLFQAQKMESVGRLAGGVAHDFNNLLMGIMNYVDLCRDSLAADHPVRCYLDEISTVAQRSADLTRQLLAFARRQTIAPQVLDFRRFWVCVGILCWPGRDLREARDAA